MVINSEVSVKTILNVLWYVAYCHCRKERCSSTGQLFINCTNLDSTVYSLVHDNQLWIHMSCSEDSVAGLCCFMCISSPSIFSWGYIKLCLCQVPKPTVFFWPGSSSGFRIKFPTCRHFLNPSGPCRSLSLHPRHWAEDSVEFIRKSGQKAVPLNI